MKRAPKIIGTSSGLVPSGRLAIAGFTDGTLRLFDLTGIFAKDKNHPALKYRDDDDNDDHDDIIAGVSSSAKNDANNPNNSNWGNDATSTCRRRKEGSGGTSSSSSSAVDMLFDDDASSNDDEVDNNDIFYDDSTTKRAGRRVVDSRSNQRYGAVSCQIHARGVHTSLLMDVAVSEDGLYAFGGVQRGSVELAAVYLGDVEAYLDERLLSSSSCDYVDDGETSVGLLDLIQVDRHADAKLKGFGACTRLWNGWERARNGIERPEYLLCTGKGIKVRERKEVDGGSFHSM